MMEKKTPSTNESNDTAPTNDDDKINLAPPDAPANVYVTKSLDGKRENQDDTSKDRSK